MKKTLFLLLLLPAQVLWAQQAETSTTDKTDLTSLTVEKIMRDPLWIGTSPSDIFWGPNSQKLYFMWNPEKTASDSLYYITLENHHPQKVDFEERQWIKAQRTGSWNRERTKLTFKKGQGIYVLNLVTGKRTKVVETTADISNPTFGLHGTAVVYRSGKNLMRWDIETGTTTQLTNFKAGKAPSTPDQDEQEAFLEEDALANSKVLRQRKKQQEKQEALKEKQSAEALAPIYIESAKVTSLSLSPNGDYVMYRLTRFPDAKHTLVPHYVTQSGYTENLHSRAVVGTDRPTFDSYIYELETRESHKIDIEQIPGIRDIADYIQKDYPQHYKELKQNPPLRSVRFSAPIWNKEGTKAFVVIRALDHKDRWIMLLDMATGKLKLLDRQHDEAWVAGPGIGYTYSTGNVGWINPNTIWYQSSESGYSHLYLQNVNSGKVRQLTHGKYEVQFAECAPNRKSFYLITNKVAPGQKQYYQLDIKSGKQVRMTPNSGSYQIVVSPDGKYVAERYSTIIHPWELYLQANHPGAKSKQITHKAESAEYKSYDWQKPDVITFTDRDGFEVYAQLYKPEQQAASRPGVIFVHGAGYLQDVLNHWGHYFREHLFINLLVDKGYTVMNIDYRGSAGYGRDWRTAIYRHMGGNDLEDIVDGAQYMVEKANVNPENIGIWGGSYGGFMTLMALFNTEVFESGAALRSVTDWAHYNHGYTSNILNTPQSDPIAYKRSSPIYFAKGLDDQLLMCHGMVDPNVHFQDIVRLTQKLIELGKENWELAVYPVEGHGFVEPSSWTDEYRRILKLFEETLK